MVFLKRVITFDLKEKTVLISMCVFTCACLHVCLYVRVTVYMCSEYNAVETALSFCFYVSSRVRNEITKLEQQMSFSVKLSSPCSL